MKFSQQFGITRDDSDDWFDPNLERDNELFIDPFLLYKSKNKGFRDAHQEVIEFFNIAFKLVALSKGQKDSSYYKEAVRLLQLGEFSGIWLGYTEDSNEGSGFGPELAQSIAEAMWTAIENGLQNLSHFYSIPLFQERIGPDRISDSVACIIRRQLVHYTQKVCKKYHITTQKHRFNYGKFNFTTHQWEPYEADLPFKLGTKKPIMLVPMRFLRELPSIDDKGFWYFCKENYSDQLRKAFGDDIKKRVSKAEILHFARTNPQICDKFISHEKETRDPDPYQKEQDVMNLDRGYFFAQRYAQAHPYTKQIESTQKMPAFLSNVIQEFKNLIEYNRGWERLWINSKKHVQEKSLHNLFYALLLKYMDDQKISFTPKLEVGKKPLSFTLPNNSRYLSLIRIRYSRNLKIGTEQIPKLIDELSVEGMDSKYLVVVTRLEEDQKWQESFQRIFKEATNTAGISVKLVFIDGRNRRIKAP